MTEKSGGSDINKIETTARNKDGQWYLDGEKWFSSHVDADIALILARPEGAADDSSGVALFAMPRYKEDGTRNSYRIVRLKDKLGTRSMASGELVIEGAFAYLIGRVDQGLKQMLEQVNLSRLSHAVRAAAMMRRCLNESMQAVQRVAFNQRTADFPLMKRQLLKIMLPTEASLSAVLFAANIMQKSNTGDTEAKLVLRILTPLLKFRTCRDNIDIATAAMEVRGGNGYIEDFINARLVRDAHIGVLWEGTSNINALDVIQRAVKKEKAHIPLFNLLAQKIDEVALGFPLYAEKLNQLSDKTQRFVVRVADQSDHEEEIRKASSALYYLVVAVILAWETLKSGDGRRILISNEIIKHKLEVYDPLDISISEHQITELLLGSETDVSLAVAQEMLSK